MSPYPQNRQPSGAAASAGGRYTGHGRATGGTLTGLSDADLIAAASDLSSFPRTLSSLSFSKVDAVRVAAAGNPRTPVKDLLRMLNRGADSRRAVLGNPALPAETMLAVAAAPRAGDLAALAANPALPGQVAALCAVGPVDAQLAVAARPDCPVTVFDSLAGSDNAQVLAAVLAGASRATRMRAGRKLSMMADGVVGDPRVLASDPSADPRVLAALAFSKDEIVRASVAGNLGTPPGTLTMMLNRGSFIRGVALRNPSLPVDVQLSVASRPLSDDLSNLSANGNATEEILGLCSFGGGMSPYRVAAHRNTGPAVFERFSLSGNPQLLETVAGNPAAPAGARAEASRRLAEVRARFELVSVA